MSFRVDNVLFDITFYATSESIWRSFLSGLKKEGNNILSVKISGRSQVSEKAKMPKKLSSAVSRSNLGRILCSKEIIDDVMFK